MKLSILSAALLLGCIATTPVHAISDEETAARSAAFALAGAFSNDGFKIRDGFWSGPINAREPVIVQVNLYAGNAYWFSAGAADQARKIEVAIFDETGAAVAAEPYQDGPRAAAGFEPTVSGPYYIRIRELEGEPASAALLYSYK